MNQAGIAQFGAGEIDASNHLGLGLDVDLDLQLAADLLDLGDRLFNGFFVLACGPADDEHEPAQGQDQARVTDHGRLLCKVWGNRSSPPSYPAKWWISSGETPQVRYFLITREHG